jgi:hypothetical protein
LAEEAGATGGVVAVVDLDDVADGAPVDAARVVARTVPGVIVGVLHGELTPAAAAWAELVDVVLAGDGELERLVDSVSARPRAAAALALLLRREQPSVADGLVAESAVYSMLQGGPEFSAWRAGRPPDVAPPQTDGAAAPVNIVRDGNRMTVTLSRPDRHNALNTTMRDALAEALAVGLADPAVEVMLRGDGPSFCSGGDLAEFGTTPDPVTSHLIRLTRSPAALAARLGSRLEARVHGACLGAGVELAAFAGRVVAHSETVFALPELAFGLIPGAGGTVSLPRRIGRHRTAWLALTGERIDAMRAHRWGLVDEIV